ncbi:MAG: acyl-CoA dehydratase activase [Desulfobacterales bacterium]
MFKNSNILGVDIGSVSISIVEMAPDKQIVRTAYEFHQGKITETLIRVLSHFDLPGVCGIASTSSTPPVLRVNQRYDNRVSIMKATRFFHDSVCAILIVGGEKFGLIRFDDLGNYFNFKSNTSCAAGTGSFLDQQAGRLGLSNIGELSELAFKNNGPVPKIASRCAVFAKTDLAHAQQEGYTLSQICDGLCMGLAKNIVDTLFGSEKPRGPIVFSGGVSRNQAVVKHIRSMLDQEILVEKSLYGAAGAALNLLDELLLKDRIHILSAHEIILDRNCEKTWFYPPLTLQKTTYPEFDSVETFEYRHPEISPIINSPVEVDIYESITNSTQKAYLGIDIGSTSTKAVLVRDDHTVLAGFYTRTAGRPVDAIRIIFEAIDYTVRKNLVDLCILGCGTTGSGRKFVGKIVGADLIIDEITAHARAAVEIEPAVDTIIEIGGQDSKFTTLRKGRVTFSIMNAVCAAGTGSFVEEQARKLGCPLSEYSAKTENRRSPIASDRCTVFMERDINYYLSEGYEQEEVLASVLHSIVENYLTKVAIESSIGDTVFFQGATAKNKALVAAFEQRLQKPIHVSKYCHLTGALGTALSLSDQKIQKTGFRGISLYRNDIPITSEVCELCTNHCKISVADINGEKVAYGFFCGRDYDTGKFIDNNRSGFNLLKSRKKVFAFTTENRLEKRITVGLPAGLHMHEDLPFWRRFFERLSIKTVTSEKYQEAVKKGKQIAGAEFCAPLAALYGHVDYLLDRADYVFLPFYLEKKVEEKNRRRQFCYYTQFSPSLIAAATKPETRGRLLMPLENYLYSSFHDKIQLYQMLKPILPGKIGFFDVSFAYDAACEFKRACDLELKKIYQKESDSDDLHVILLGRPYTALASSMNKRIPEIFGSLGVKTFYQDMLSYSKEDVRAIEPLLDEVHWNYAAGILEAAVVSAQTRGAYPVLITSFKCTPDSFVMDYFKKIMESYDKPYLILQLDDHDSSVGYETRIEAAIRSFENHHHQEPKSSPPRYVQSLVQSKENQLEGRTLLIPNWDSISLRFLTAAFQKEGIDARLLDENEVCIQKSLRYNTGQCIPLNIIAQEFIDYVENHDLDPAKTMLWMIKSSMACNLALFPYHLKNIFQTYGHRMEKAGVFAGELSFMDISMKLPLNTYFAYMFGGLIRKVGCKIRPYEKNKGETDRVIENNIDILIDAFRGNRSKNDALEEVIGNFEWITLRSEPMRRPKVAIFGDLYVRDNEVMNQNLIHYIEENGGEVVVTPFSSHMKMIAKPYLQKWFREGLYFSALSHRTLIAALKQLEKTYERYFERILKEPKPAYDESPEKILSEYNMIIENSGESLENVLKIFYTKKHYPDISLFVQTSPAFCCPSLVTEAMAGEIERKIGVPIVSITYDGTGGNKNDAIIPYLKFPRTTLQDRKRRTSQLRSLP